MANPFARGDPAAGGCPLAELGHRCALAGAAAGRQHPLDPAAYDINQFANAEQAIAYFEGTPAQSENLANELLLQLKALGQPRPDWFVVGAGSGGTATSVGRYMRKWSPLTSADPPPGLLVMDPEHSVLFDWVVSGDASLHSAASSRIEGVGSGSCVEGA